MTPRVRALLVGLAALLPACSRRPATRNGGAAASERAPAPPEHAEAAVQRIGSRDDVPLRGPRVDAKPGDYLLEGTGGVAVVSAAKGTLVDFGEKGGEDALVGVDPTVFMGLDELPSIVETVAPAGAGSHAVLVRRRVLSDPALTLWTYVTFAGGALRIESVATAQDRPALAVTLGEVVAWGNVPTWVEAHGFVDEKGSYSGDFIAREGLGIAYALAPEHGHVIARFPAGEAGFHPWARTGEQVESIPAHGASTRRVVWMTQAHGRLGEAVRVLPRAPGQAVDRYAAPDASGEPEGAFVDVASCEGEPYARFEPQHAVELPHGCWRVRWAARGHAAGAWSSPDDLGKPARAGDRPLAGELHWAVREKGKGAIPARLAVRGVGNPDPDWGEGFDGRAGDGAQGASLNVVYSDRDGQIPVPPGRYRVTVTRGFEYTSSESDVTIAAGKTSSLEATLERVVDTSGWISADLHVHALPSPDAPVPLAERVRALAASGVEVAVATDHNAITDYSSTIGDLGLRPWLVSIVGDEVSTRGVTLGHFNVFPLAPGSPPPPFDHIAPPALVASARTAAPAGQPKIVQMNHPRIGAIGYFELLRFDPRDVEGWRARSALNELGFDAIEVYNGDQYAMIDQVERAMRDWYALLDAGVRITATGNSDSHKLTYHECGVPRNFVQMGQGGDDPARFDESRFVDAVRRGRVVVSGGPLVHLDVAGHGVGDAAPAGEDDVHVTVDAPPWVDVSRVDLVTHGRVLHSWAGPFAPSVRRLDAHFTATLAKGDWIVAVARGDEPMAYLARPGAVPFGFTNPVWVE